MENKIFLYDLASYERASPEKKRKITDNYYFDLCLLPTEGMREEIQAFIKERDKTISLEMMIQEKNMYKRICRFMKDRHIRVDSFQAMELDTWILRLKGWMLENGMKIYKQGISVYGKEKTTPSALITYFRKIYNFTIPEDTRDEKEKDIWVLDKLDITYKRNPIKNFKTLNFTGILQPDMREELKKGTYRHLQEEALGTIVKEITAVKRLSEYLMENFPEITSLEELNREIFEEYLTYLRTEDTGLNKIRSDLTKLRGILETIGKVYQYENLNNLFLKYDIPPMGRTELKSYTDGELKRLNAAFAQMDVEMCRVMVIHQMLGTRISDTLTLETDCLFEQNQHPMIRIQQMKTSTYIKPISAELALLIKLAIEDTRKKFGETKYVFVNEKKPERPLQYNTIQNRVMSMIYKEDLRDDNGELFGFGTHMFRHCYGIKLTEMHLDDWTIARLLGHKSLKNVKYYRKMSHQILADETREIRDEMSRMIRANLSGWGEEYEQI